MTKIKSKDFYENNKVFTHFVIIALVFMIFGMVNLMNDTYAADNQYVIFEGIDGHQGSIIRSCLIGSDGKLAASCIADANKICRTYTRTYRGSDAVDLNGTFTSGTTLYCLAGSSTSAAGYTWGCYKCPDDPSIVKWLIYSGSYAMPDSMRRDANCSKLLVDTGIKDDKLCVPTETPTPACYECKNDTTVMKWDTDGNADSKCTAGYNKTTKTQAECSYVAPTNACYECKTDSNIVKWKDNATGDDNCPAGYNKTTKTEANCKVVVPENPKTGGFRVFLVLLLACVAMGLSLLSLKREELLK